MIQKVCAIAAIGRNRELGKDNKLLWQIPSDIKRFVSLTKGHPLILGRKTFESIVGYRGAPLPERTNIVITHNNDLRSRYIGYPNVVVVSSLGEALERAKQSPGSEEILIGGGAEIYKEALPQTDRLYLTLIDADAEADTFFPPYADVFTKKILEEEHEWNGLTYRYLDLEKER